MDRRQQRRLLKGCEAAAHPSPADGLYSPERVNAADQRHDHHSFWWFIRDLIYTYRQQPEIGWSTVEICKQPNPAVLAHVCREESGWAMVALHNFGADSGIVPIQLEDVPEGCILVDLLNGLSEHKLDATAGPSSASKPTATDGCACCDRKTSRSSEPAGDTSSRCSPVRRRGDRVPVLGRGSSDQDPAGTAGPGRRRPGFHLGFRSAVDRFAGC